MTDGAPLRLIDEAPEAATTDEPQVFVRSFSAPPGAPWDQVRAARLEARGGAPLPLVELAYQVRRLEPWRPGRASKFAAFYAQTADVGERLKAEVVVDGRALEVEFVSRSHREQQARRAGVIVAAGAGGVVALVVAFALAISARQNAEAQLSDLETLAAAKARIAHKVKLQRRAATALEAAGVKGRSLDDYLGDLDWAASAKAPGARIQAVHWDRAALAVEVRGDAAPFVPGLRTATKVDKALRPGVWLWGVVDQRSPPIVRLAGAGDVRSGP